MGKAKQKGAKDAKPAKKPSQVARVKEDLRKKAERLDQNFEQLSRLGLIDQLSTPGDAPAQGAPATLVATKRQKKKLQHKAKRAKTVPKGK